MYTHGSIGPRFSYLIKMPLRAYGGVLVYVSASIGFLCILSALASLQSSCFIDRAEIIEDVFVLLLSCKNKRCCLLLVQPACEICNCSFSDAQHIGELETHILLFEITSRPPLLGSACRSVVPVTRSVWQVRQAPLAKTP